MTTTLTPNFAAAVETTEYAIYDALLSATAITGYQKHHRQSLRDLLNNLSATT